MILTHLVVLGLLTGASPVGTATSTTGAATGSATVAATGASTAATVGAASGSTAVSGVSNAPPPIVYQTSQTSTVAIAVDAILRSPRGLGTVTDVLRKRYSVALAGGTGSGQANAIWHDQRTLNSSDAQDLDFAGGLTSSVTGTTLTFATIKLIFVACDAANVDNVVLSRPASNGVAFAAAAGDAVVIQPQGVFLLAAPGAGLPVIAGTGDLITLTNASSSQTAAVDIIVIGVTA